MLTFLRPLTGLAALSVLLGAGSPAIAQAPPPVSADASARTRTFSSAGLAELNAAMDAFVDEDAVGGISTLLVQGDREIAFHAYGERNAASGAPVTRDTIFRIYSMTKPITAVAMMILYEEGRWSLDDPITVYLPEMSDLRVAVGQTDDGQPILEDATRPPTMRELMSHTGGFAYGMPTDPRLASTLFREANVASASSMDDLVARVATLPLLAQPGTEWNYSISIDLLGAVIERLSGQRLEDFFKDRIFAPLKMTDTGFTVPTDDLNRLVDLYATDPGTGRAVPVPVSPQTIASGLVRDYSVPPVVPSAGGGLVSTIGDYARFARMLANGGELDGERILRRDTVALMDSNQIPAVALGRPNANGIAFGQGLGFGLGVMVVTDPAAAGAPDGLGTMSWDGAASTWFWVDPENDIVFVGMVQRMGGPVRLQLQARSRKLVYAALGHRLINAHPDSG